jgi:hypothetical protein
MDNYPEPWVEYNDLFVGKIKLENDCVCFPILDRYSDILIHIEFVDALDYFSQKTGDTKTLQIKQLSGITANVALHLAYGKPKNLEKAIFINEGNNLSKFDDEYGQKQRLEILKTQNEPNNCRKISKIVIGINSLMRLLNLSGSHHEYYYEPLLYMLYSKINRDENFPRELFRHGKNISGERGFNNRKTIFTTLLPIEMKLYVKKWRVVKIESKGIITVSKSLKNEFLRQMTVETIASPRVLNFCYPVQLTEDIFVLKSHEKIAEMMNELPIEIRKIFGCLPRPEQLYCLHYFNKYNVILPVAIHPICSMIFCNTYRKIE